MLELANKIQNQNNDFTNLATKRDIVEVILKEYKKICNENDFDYEFHYIDDILNDSGAEYELNRFFKTYSPLDIAS